MTLIAIDIGGSGSRILAAEGSDLAASGPPLTISDGRADHPAVVVELAKALGPVRGSVSVVAVGAAGLLAHGDAVEISAAVASVWPDAAAVVASDAVTATAGAWGESGGAVVAAGTGVVAFATDFADLWLRSDGWGYLFGDSGGAAWIGARGLDAALRELDGRPGGSASLLAATRERYGDPLHLPEVVRAAANPATTLAAFAPAVTAAATLGDTVAQAIVSGAVRELADTGLSVVRDGIPSRLALVGGLTAEPAIANGFAARVRELRPEVEVGIGAGSPLDGALALARRALDQRLTSHLPYLTVFPHPPTL